MDARERNKHNANVAEGLAEFADPIEFLYGEHERLRLCCEQLLQLADNLDAEDASEVAGSILVYMENELPLHIADEEEDLFPLLKRRSPQEDRVQSVIELLGQEHQEDVEIGRSLLEALRSIAAGTKPGDPRMFADYVRAFTMLQRRHHALENTVVLPLAYERFTSEDMTELSRRMAARRGMSDSG